MLLKCPAHIRIRVHYAIENFDTLGVQDRK